MTKEPLEVPLKLHVLLYIRYTSFRMIKMPPLTHKKTHIQSYQLNVELMDSHKKVSQTEAYTTMRCCSQGKGSTALITTRYN